MDNQRFEIGSRHLYDTETKTIIVSDIHLEKGVRMDSQYGSVKTPNTSPSPTVTTSQLLDKLERLIKEHTVNRLIINGDMFHYANPSENSIQKVVDFTTKLEDNNIEVVFVIGNHDDQGLVIFDDDKFDSVDAKAVEGLWLDSNEDIYLTHGHKDPQVDADWYIIGHIHPVMGSSTPCHCYHKTIFNGKGVWILPPFNPVLSGFDVYEDEIFTETHPFLTDVDLSEFTINSH